MKTKKVRATRSQIEGLAAAVRGVPDQPVGDHPSDDEFVLYSMDPPELSADVIAKMDAHFVSCDDCAVRIEHLLEVSKAWQGAAGQDRLVSLSRRIQSASTNTGVATTTADAADLLERHEVKRAVAEGAQVNAVRQNASDGDGRASVQIVPHKPTLYADDQASAIRRGGIWPRSLVQWGAAAAAVFFGALLLWPERSMRLSDASRTITIGSDGALYGLDGVPPAMQAEVASAIRTSRLPLPADIMDLQATRGTLLGGTSEEQEVILRPLGVVLEDRPLFEWRGNNTTSQYSVYVFGTDGTEIARSALTRERRWTPDATLPSGQVLRWQIVAFEGDREQVFPVPPAPEARFRIADRALVEELNAARRLYGGSHLVMAVVYAKAGLVQEARLELSRLSADNPGSDLPSKLLESLPRP